MNYIVALGNPGEEYVGTRHNIGWAVADFLVSEFSLTEPVSSSKYQGLYSHGQIGKDEVNLLYPTTFMNNSGSAVKKLVPASELSQLIVLHDDVDLPLGEIKISTNRGAGGHNGVKSIIEKMGSNEFLRIRIGVAQKSFFTGKVKRPTGDKLPRFVLAKFTRSEEKILQEIGKLVAQAVVQIVNEGTAVAMNKFN
jgi:peptidyl-tRNA hydrolase, PTH1 family